MTDLINYESLHPFKDRLNYKSPNVGISSDNLANFATLSGCNLAGNSLFQVIFHLFTC